MPELQSIIQHMVNVEGGVRYIGDINHLYRPIFGRPIPVTIVRVSDFMLCDHPVTEAEWDAVMGGTSKSLLPKVDVSWNDAIQFILRLNSITGKKYRLPTEAEWEFAARGGVVNRVDYLFSGSRILLEVGWFETNSNGSRQPVMQLNPNGLGLYDMSGNVWEWCSDWFDWDYEQGEFHLFGDNDPVLDPHGPQSGSKRVIRGGSYSNEERNCWVFWRGKESPSRSFINVGFRLAMNA